jgi:hypothetical protein
MKNLDLKVIANFPKVPHVQFVLEKNGEIEVLNSYKELKDWCSEVLSSEIEDAYYYELQDSDGQTGYEDAYDWFANEIDACEFVQECDWNLVKVAS